MICIIQARMSSRRIKGKVLKKVNGSTLLARVIEQVSKSKKIKKIIIATSDKFSDKAIVNYCKRNNYNYYCGSLSNVYLRYAKVIKLEKVKSFVRICADSPAINPKLIDKSINYYEENNCDIVTNTFPRTFPKGLSVEVINSNTFLETLDLIKKSRHKEHITSFFYDHSQNYRIYNIKNNLDYSDISLAIDTVLDLMYMRKLFKNYNSAENIYKKLKIKLKFG